MLYSILLCSQNDFFAGELYDSNSNEPVPFATIRVKGYAIGVISNQDGGFKIPIKFKDYGQILEISSMGYQKKEVSIFDLTEDQVNVIRLSPGILELNEVVVKGKVKDIPSAREIVERAIENISRNYPYKPFSTVGYYRDYQYDNGLYVNLNEAIFEVFDEGFAENDNKTSSVLIYELKENNAFPKDTNALKPYDYNLQKKVIEKAVIPSYGGNEFEILRIHDAVRNHNIDTYSFVHQLDSDLLRNHFFQREEDTYYDKENLYTISFEKELSNKNDFKNFDARGVLYISKIDYSIYFMQYSVYNKKEKLPKGELNKYGNKWPVLFEVKVEYRKIEDKMYLNYISLFNKFQIQEPPKFLMTQVIMDLSNKCFNVTFNNEPAIENLFKSRNYNMRYHSKKLNFENIEPKKKGVILYPKMNIQEFESMFKEINSITISKTPDPKLFSLNIKNIEDKFGNVINERTSKDFSQFREFFVQEVTPNSDAPMNSKFMVKNRPIFKEQPETRPENLDQYWMNTPLQQIEQ